MNVKKLQLTDFRNYEHETFEYCDGINIVSGGNAQGKTNSAEAIFYLCAGYSPRANRDRQVIRRGAEKASIVGIADGIYGSVKVGIDFYSDNAKEVKVNDVKISRSGELLGNINSVFGTPPYSGRARRQTQISGRFAVSVVASILLRPATLQENSVAEKRSSERPEPRACA